MAGHQNKDHNKARYSAGRAVLMDWLRDKSKTTKDLREKLGQLVVCPSCGEAFRKTV